MNKNTEQYDVVIIGGGSAGLTASIYCGRARLKTLVIEKSLVGGLATYTNEIENYVNKNPTDKSAITDLFFTKIRFTSKEVVIEEIDQMQENAEADKDFYEALKESIKFAPKM